MKEKIVFATHNKHKLEEVSALLADQYDVIGLDALGCEDIPETADTLQGNARLKSLYVYEKYGYNCFSDDSGLEVEALEGAPGVYSARYAGEEHNDAANNKKLLEELAGVTNRNARFRSVISLIEAGKETLFEGCVYGTILLEPRGENGFGYDPLFQPTGFDYSFAELDLSLKNKISHRGKAVEQLVTYLQK